MFIRWRPLVWSPATVVSLGAPQPAGRAAWVGSANHRLVVGQRVQEGVISLDEGLLFGLVELARHRLRLALLDPQTMQQVLSG